jgi:outer membrane lipoprotein-sorting protein
MGCLSQEQLARLALDLPADGEAAGHLQQCAACRGSLESLRLLRRQLIAAHAQLDRGHAAARERLLAFLRAASPPPEPARPWHRFNHWMGGLTMRQRLVAMSGLGATVVVAMLLIWSATLSPPVSAMERMAENIRKAKSYTCVQTVQRTDEYPDPGKPSVTEAKYTVYWLAPGSARSEDVQSREWKGPGPEYTEVFPAGKPSIFIDHRTKKYYRSPPLRNGPYSSTFDDLQNLSRFCGRAARDLGTRQIDSKTAHGFQIDMKTMSADPSESGQAEIWLDPQSSLPVLVRYEGMKGLGYSNTQVDSDIRWNVDLDPRLFDPTPPAGYTDATRRPPTLEEQVRRITRSLKIYAEASGGRYPQNRVNPIDTVEELCRMLGVAKWPGGDEDEKGNVGKAARAIRGFEQMGKLLAHNPGAVYSGKAVGPNDKGKVLFRWKLDDGRYEVIFGDLRSETVTAEKLHLHERQ